MIHRAAWVLPIADVPIRDGWVRTDAGRVTAVGAGAAPGAADDLGSVAVLPALVNAHTHLELSHLAGQVPAGARMDDWIRGLLAARAAGPRPDAPEVARAAREAVAAARAAGTGLVGEVANTLATVAVLREAGMPARVFHEVIGFAPEDVGARVAAARAAVDAVGADGGDVRVALAPHAPYSVSPALFAAIRADLDAHPGAVSSVHLAESEAEVALLRDGRGPLRDLLESLGVWHDGWRPPGVSPVAYLEALGFLDRRILAVHGVQCTGVDLGRLRALDVTVVSCPRSNRHVGSGPPPLEAFYAADVAVAFGTDSLTSAATLSVFDELAEARRVAPRVPARRLLESATRIGARALGFGDTFGAIEPGLRASLIAVRVPAGVEDVEEYLVSGVPAGAVRWLDTAA